MTSEKLSSVWDAISDTPEEAANLRARAEVMRHIASVIEAHGWTQSEAGERAHITQPRMNDLVNGRVSKFSLDALVQVASALGLRFHIELDELEAA